MYVALTRTMHHLSVLVTADSKGLLPTIVTHMPEKRPLASVPALKNYEMQDKKTNLSDLLCAGLNSSTAQTYHRTSFSGIMDIRKKSNRRDFFEPSGHGNDEFGDGDNISLSQEENDSSEKLNSVMIPSVPSSKAVGDQIHDILEIVDTSVRPLRDEVRRAVEQVATSSLLRNYHEPLTEMLTRALETPFGGVFGDVSFADIGPEDRLPEMEFEMTVALSNANILVSDIGRVLLSVLSADDVLYNYAISLTDSSFNIPIAGLVNGSLDALIRLPDSTPEQPLLAITDYKSNKLHGDTEKPPLSAYSSIHVQAKMEEAHYILQALIYGTSVYRMLRWRLPKANHDACIKGIAYGFLRGMAGPDMPPEQNGHRYGVFTWQAPPGLWSALSDLFAGKKPTR